MPESQHLNLASLRERGWTPALVRAFLGEPDKTKANPFYKSAAPQKLYLVDRVKKIEASEPFLAKKALAAKRSHVSLVRAEKARQALAAEVLSKVRVRNMPFDVLRHQALSSQTQRNETRGDFSSDPASAQEHHIHRWMVNYARHELSNYDQIRIRYAGKVGVHEAAEAVRSAVLTRIAELWPPLGKACRQAERVDEYD